MEATSRKAASQALGREKRIAESAIRCEFVTILIGRIATVRVINGRNATVEPLNLKRFKGCFKGLSLQFKQNWWINPSGRRRARVTDEPDSLRAALDWFTPLDWFIDLKTDSRHSTDSDRRPTRTPSHLLTQMLAPAYQLSARDQIAPAYQLSALDSDHSQVIGDQTFYFSLSVSRRRPS